MIAAILEFSFFFLFEFFFYTIFYWTGALLIRFLTLWKIRFPLWGRQVFKERKDEVDQVWLCISIGLLFYLTFVVLFYLYFFGN